MSAIFYLLLAFLARPIGWVRIWLTPRVRRDQRIESLQSWRAGLGYLGLVALLVSNKDDKTLQSTVTSFLQAPILKAAIALPCFLLAAVILIAKTHSGHRAGVARRAAAPWFLALGVMIGPFALILLAGWKFGAYSGRAGAAQMPSPGWFLLFVFLVLPFLPAAFVAQVLSVKYSFRAADVHPFMPALVGSAVAAVTVVKSIFDIAGSQATLQVQLGLFSLGGGLIVAALCAYEFLRLNQFGYTWHSQSPPAYPGAVGRSVRTSSWLPWAIAPALVLLIAPTTPAPAGGAPLAAFVSPTRGSSATPRSGTTARPAPGGHRVVVLRPVAVTASDTSPPGTDDSGQQVSYDAGNLVDGNPATAWRAPESAVNQTIVLTFATPVHLTSVGIIPGYAKKDAATGQDRFRQNRRVTSVSWSSEGKPIAVQSFLDQPTMQLKPLAATAKTLTMTITGTSAPGQRDYTAVSEIRIMGYVGG